MSSLRDPRTIKRGVAHLKTRDPVMAAVIARVGSCALRPSRERYRLLVRSILSQQISVKAAQSIRRRLIEMMPAGNLNPQSVASLTVRQMRRAGISKQKAGYLLNLSNRVNSGELNFRRVGQLTNEGVIEELVQVKGIGRWTAQMFLIFGLGRVDVFPPNDLGIRQAIRSEYGFEEMPTVQQCNEIASAWTPFASIASWYCWRSLDCA